MTPDMDALRDAVAEHEPRSLPEEGMRIVAAVAVVLRAGRDGLEVLLIHRAVNPRDPWSGHMSFPGGRVHPEDPDTLSAAVRETAEEVGLDLERDAELLGRLSDIVPRGRARRLGVVAVPHVFALKAVPEPVPNPDEVREVVWLPLAFLADHTNRSAMWWRRRVLPVRMPCYRYRGHLVWGMTLRALDELVEVVRPALVSRKRGAVQGTP